MNFINKMERKFGRFAVPNLTVYLIGGYVIGYIFQLIARVSGYSIFSLLTLEPYYILHGQLWRIVSWVLTPPSSLDIFTIIMLLLYYQLGSALEKTWGVFRYNLYIFSGIFFTFIGAMVLYFVLTAITGSPVGIGGYFSTYYINLSIFLAFAACYPDMQLLLYFIIPVKIKWLAWIDIAFLAWQFISCGSLTDLSSWATRVAILVSLLNFVLFFFGGMRQFKPSPQQRRRQAAYKRQVNAARTAGYKTIDGKITKHKCAVCGRTELDGENLEFRFCSKCNGNYEYCQDHLFTHEHVK